MPHSYILWGMKVTNKSSSTYTSNVHGTKGGERPVAHIGPHTPTHTLTTISTHPHPSPAIGTEFKSMHTLCRQYVQTNYSSLAPTASSHNLVHHSIRLFSKLSRHCQLQQFCWRFRCPGCCLAVGQIWGICIQWTGVLEWSAGMEHWSGELDWSAGLECWRACMTSS
jgi:hypothetical protein